MKRITGLLAVAVVALSMSAFASTPDLSTCDVYILACHYTNSSRETSYNINRVVIHKTEGATASGAANWFANCDSGGSAHFTFDKANGYCYQSVLEEDIAWQAGYSSTNSCSVGIEHSGWVSSNDTSTACYDESAIETKSCVTYYAVPCNRTYIIGHNQVPGCANPGGGGTSCHTDPGAYWNWNYYMSKCNPVTNVDRVCDNSSGSFTASANWSTGSSAADKYGADYRFRTTAALSDAAQWTISVNGGSYTISAWWSVGTNRSTNVPYQLPNGANVYVNQQANGGKWNTLATGVSLGAGAQATKLSCWAATGYVAVADAVKYYGP